MPHSPRPRNSLSRCPRPSAPESCEFASALAVIPIPSWLQWRPKSSQRLSLSLASPNYVSRSPGLDRQTNREVCRCVCGHSSLPTLGAEYHPDAQQSTVTSRTSSGSTPFLVNRRFPRPSLPLMESMNKPSHKTPQPLSVTCLPSLVSVEVACCLLAVIMASEVGIARRTMERT